MGTVEDLIIKLKELPQFIEEVVDNYLTDNEEDVLDLNKAQLLNAGVDSEGVPLGEYSARTKEERQKKGLQTDFIDLRYTGEFQDKMDLIKTGEAERTLTSTDSKWQSGELSDRFPDAIGLTPVSEDILTDAIIKEIEFQVDNFL